MALLLDELPTEIIHNIIVYILDSSPRSGGALRLANKCLAEATKVTQSRRMTVAIDEKQETHENLSKKILTYEHVHHLTINSATDTEKYYHEPELFIKLIKTIKTLKSLTWNLGPISPILLSILAKCHPACSLRIFRWWRIDTTLVRLHESEVALASFKSLTHLRYVPSTLTPSMNNIYGLSSPVAGAWSTFQEMVTMSSSLQTASFVHYGEASGASIRRNWHKTVLPEGADAETPKLYHLKNLTIDSPTLDLSSSTLEQIAAFTDISALENLKLSRGVLRTNYFVAAASALSGLKHISLNFSNINSHVDGDSLIKAAKDYLITCSPAETLSIWNWTAVIELKDLLNHHGKSLKTLQLHTKEDIGRVLPEYTMDTSDVVFIMLSCPNLVDLTFDFDMPETRFGMRPHSAVLDSLKAIAAKRVQMQRVQIYLPCFGLGTTTQSIWNRGFKLTRGEIRRALRDGTYGGTSGSYKDNLNWDEDSDHEQAKYDNTIDSLDAHLRRLERRKKVVRALVEPYAIDMWKALFSQCSTGDRTLHVKFGDWEAHQFPNANDARTWCAVSPQERDDRMGECFVKTRLRFLESGPQFGLGRIPIYHW